MTLSPDDLAAMGERHTLAYRNKGLTPGSNEQEEVCRTCLMPWPCDSRRLLDEVEATRTELRGLMIDADAALTYLEGLELPYRDRHRPLHRLGMVCEASRRVLDPTIEDAR